MNRRPRPRHSTGEIHTTSMRFFFVTFTVSTVLSCMNKALARGRRGHAPCHVLAGVLETHREVR